MPAGFPAGGHVDADFFEPGEEVLRDVRYLDRVSAVSSRVCSSAAAQRELETIAERLAMAYPKTNENWSVDQYPPVGPDCGACTACADYAARCRGVVLLIGAANLANLFLVRCLARQRGMAVRTALGATRGRLVLN